jgi:hypothetical protein
VLCMITALQTIQNQLLAYVLLTSYDEDNCQFFFGGIARNSGNNILHPYTKQMEVMVAFDGISLTSTRLLIIFAFCFACPGFFNCKGGFIEPSVSVIITAGATSQQSYTPRLRLQTLAPPQSGVYVQSSPGRNGYPGSGLNGYPATVGAYMPAPDEWVYFMW